MSRLDDLVILREQLLKWMDAAPVDRKAALVAQFRATLEEIESLKPKEAQGDSIDEVSRRRTARRAGTAAGKGRAKQSG